VPESHHALEGLELMRMDTAETKIREARANALVAFIKSAYLAPIADFGSLVTQLLQDRPTRGNWTRREIMRAIRDLINSNRACVMADDEPGTLCLVVPEAAKVDHQYYWSIVAKSGGRNASSN
jgi:hypothetical protein